MCGFYRGVYQILIAQVLSYPHGVLTFFATQTRGGTNHGSSGARATPFTLIATQTREEERTMRVLERAQTLLH